MRDEMIMVRMTDAERRALEELAKRADKPASTYLRQVLVAEARRVALLPDVRIDRAAIRAVAHAA